MSVPFKFIDQENVTNENAPFPVSKQSSIRSFKAKRIPLGGKDSNKAIPTLHKAQSSFNDVKSQRRNILTTKTPSTLHRANSTLGFAPREIKSQSKNLLKFQKTSKIIKNFTPNLTFPTKSIEFSDSLIKKDAAPLPPLTQSLNSTFSHNTSLLHASNIPLQNHGRIGDPLKKDYEEKPSTSYRDRDCDRDQLIEELSQDPSSIESIPQKKSVRNIPDDMKPLTKDDLDFFSKPNRMLVVDGEGTDDYEEKVIIPNEQKLQMENLNLNDPNNFKFDDDDDDEYENEAKENNRNNDEFKKENLGMSFEDMENLIDF